MIQVERRTHSVNIFKSTFISLSLSTDPSPSESMIRRLVPFSKGNGLPHTQRPFVHAFTVDPVLNPDILSMSKFARKDFPLLYGPVKAMIAN